MRRELAAGLVVMLAAGTAAAEGVVKLERIQNGLDLIADVTVRNTGRGYLTGEVECEFRHGRRPMAVGRAPIPPLGPKDSVTVWVKVAGRDLDVSDADCRIIESAE